MAREDCDDAVKLQYLQGLLLKEGQRIGKDVQCLHSLPVGCVEVRADGQVLTGGQRTVSVL